MPHVVLHLQLRSELERQEAVGGEPLASRDELLCDRKFDAEEWGRSWGQIAIGGGIAAPAVGRMQQQLIRLLSARSGGSREERALGPLLLYANERRKRVARGAAPGLQQEGAERARLGPPRRRRQATQLPDGPSNEGEPG